VPEQSFTMRNAADGGKSNENIPSGQTIWASLSVLNIFVSAHVVCRLS